MAPYSRKVARPLEAWCLVMAAVKVVYQEDVRNRTASEVGGKERTTRSYLAVIDVTNGTCIAVSDSSNESNAGKDAHRC